jgi:hypothetical protein
MTTCANLTVGTYYDAGKHRYAKCRIGDSAARLALLKSQVVVSEYVLMDPDDANLSPPPIMPPR